MNLTSVKCVYLGWLEFWACLAWLSLAPILISLQSKVKYPRDRDGRERRHGQAANEVAAAGARAAAMPRRSAPVICQRGAFAAVVRAGIAQAQAVARVTVVAGAVRARHAGREVAVHP